jgi:hypothetical protein
MSIKLDGIKDVKMHLLKRLSIQLLCEVGKD